MHIQGAVVIVDRETTKLEGYRLEDPVRAPAVIIFVDGDKPRLLPIQQGYPPPIKVRSHNMEADIQIITYQEINAALGH
ncbi:MAG: hypothetical protein LBD10_02410 [Desulfobulbus sp.]|jgi:hypothetical protein|uniref:hypothetical protein n=1 Tax=Desulfobulbus sp. TaxID=895 RepID=UPI0028432B94|nr:hypothetical protein [Desulfobulbus sp.]MDR2549048.1 hypothetical protein [Desulfobulbus sp.]